MGKLIYIDSKGEQHDPFVMNPGHLYNAIQKLKRDNDPTWEVMDTIYQYLVENESVDIKLPSEQNREGNEL